MNRPEFDAHIARLRDRIAALPEADRAPLDALVAETIERHDGIVRSSLQAHRSLERLELAQELLVGACVRVRRLAEEARAVIERYRAAQGPATDPS